MNVYFSMRTCAAPAGIRAAMSANDRGAGSDDAAVRRTATDAGAPVRRAVAGTRPAPVPCTPAARPPTNSPAAPKGLSSAPVVWACATRSLGHVSV